MRSIGSLPTSAAMVPSVRADNALVWPAGAIDDRGRAVGAIERHQLGHDLVERVDRQMDGERRAGRGKGCERLLLAASPRRGPSVRVSTTDLRDLRQGQLLAKRRRGGRERRHAGRHGVGNARRVETAKLLAHRAPDRQIARMQARHVVAGVGGA